MYFRECQKCGRCLFTTDLYVLGASIPFCLAICITIVVSGYVSYIGTVQKLNPVHTIYVFLSWELRGLSHYFHIQVSVSDLFIPRIGPHISLQQNRKTDPGNI